MKTTLSFIALTLSLISCQADQQRTSAPNDCNCEVGHYLYVPEVGGNGGSYELQYSEAIDFNCELVHGQYYHVSNINYNYDKVTCE